MVRVIGVLLAVALLAGCGGDDGGEAEAEAPAATSYTAEDVAELAGFEPHPGSAGGWKLGRCDDLLIVPGPTGVDFYAESPEFVASPSGTTGVEYTGGDPGCPEAIRDALAGVP